MFAYGSACIWKPIISQIKPEAVQSTAQHCTALHCTALHYVEAYNYYASVSV